MYVLMTFLLFFFNDPPTPEIYTLSLHDALPICRVLIADDNRDAADSLAMLLEIEGHSVTVAGDGRQALEVIEQSPPEVALRSEEHTSELQSRRDLVCRLLLEKKKKTKHRRIS